MQDREVGKRRYKIPDPASNGDWKTGLASPPISSELNYSYPTPLVEIPLLG
jgi:hypothetical protein